MSVVVKLERDAERAVSLEAIDRAVFPRGHLDVAAEMTRPFSLLFSATLEGRLVGYLLAWHAADELEIHDVATLPEARRKGVGAALVRAACGEALARGVATVHLEVRRDNLPARALYGGVGFAENDVRRGYYEDGEDAVLMRRDLGA